MTFDSVAVPQPICKPQCCTEFVGKLRGKEKRKGSEFNVTMMLGIHNLVEHVMGVNKRSVALLLRWLFCTGVVITLLLLSLYDSGYGSECADDADVVCRMVMRCCGI